MEGDVLDLRDDPSGKWGWAPLVGFVAGAVPLLAFAGFMFLGRNAAPEPPPPPAALLAPADPQPPVAVAPVRRADPANLRIKPTGKTKVSTVGPAPEPPPIVVADGDAWAGYPRGGGASIYVAEDPNASRREPERDNRRQGGVTYRDAISADRDPLLPFGGSGHRSEGSSGGGAQFRPR